MHFKMKKTCWNSFCNNVFKKHFMNQRVIHVLVATNTVINFNQLIDKYEKN